MVGGLVGLALLGLAIYLCFRRRRARSNHPPPIFGDFNAYKGSPPMTHAQMVALNYKGYPSTAGIGATPTAAEESSNYSPVSGKPNGEIVPVPDVSQGGLQRAPNTVRLPPDPLLGQTPNHQPRSRSPSLGCRRRPAPPQPQFRHRPVEMSHCRQVQPSQNRREGVMREHEVSTIRLPSQPVTANPGFCFSLSFVTCLVSTASSMVKL